MELDNEPRQTRLPEVQLILCCARTRLDETARANIRKLLAGKLNWVEVVANAVDHHIEPLLYENLKIAGEDLVPPFWMEIARHRAQKAGALAFLYFSELLRISGIFAAEQLPLVPYKGPVLSWLAYRSLTRRRFADLDFFIEQRHISRATALLKAAGYHANFGPEEERAGRTGYAPGQYGFSRASERLLVELHTERTLRYFPAPLDFSKMSARMVAVELGGRTLRTFSTEDTLVMLCVHGAKHFWERLSWIADVAELVAAQPVDWPLALRIAAKLKCRRLLLLGLYLAHQLLEAPVPSAILKQARQDSNVRRMAGTLCEQFEGTAAQHGGVWQRGVFRFRSRDGVWQGIRHLTRLTIAPTESDREKLRLPRALAPLYFLVRPWRLLQTYGSGSVWRAQPDLAGGPAMRPDVVHRLLEFAAVEPGDVLYDLGCDDGRIVVAAAEEFGIRAVGVDINPRRIAQAKANARRRGVQDRVRFVLGDAEDMDLSDATLVTLSLGGNGVLRLAYGLRDRLRPGSRIVSYDAETEIDGWPCDERAEYESPDGKLTPLCLWRVADVPGRSNSEKSPLQPTSQHSLRGAKYT